VDKAKLTLFTYLMVEYITYTMLVSMTTMTVWETVDNGML